MPPSTPTHFQFTLPSIANFQPESIRSLPFSLRTTRLQILCTSMPTYLITLCVYVLNICYSTRTVRFANLSVLTINCFNTSKCFIFLLAPCAYVLTYLHVSYACELYVSFLICFVSFFLFVIILLVVGVILPTILLYWSKLGNLERTYFLNVPF